MTNVRADEANDIAMLLFDHARDAKRMVKHGQTQDDVKLINHSYVTKARRYIGASTRK